MSSVVDSVGGEPVSGYHGPRGGGREGLGPNYARMCVSKSAGHGSFFSFKGVKGVRIHGFKFCCVTHYNIGENLC